MFTFVTGECEGTFFELVWVGVYTGAIVQQDSCHLHMSSTRRFHQGRMAILVVYLNIGIRFDYFLYNFSKTTTSCIM